MFLFHISNRLSSFETELNMFRKRNVVREGCVKKSVKVWSFSKHKRMTVSKRKIYNFGLGPNVKFVSHYSGLISERVMWVKNVHVKNAKLSVEGSELLHFLHNLPLSEEKRSTV